MVDHPSVMNMVNRLLVNIQLNIPHMLQVTVLSHHKTLKSSHSSTPNHSRHSILRDSPKHSQTLSFKVQLLIKVSNYLPAINQRPRHSLASHSHIIAQPPSYHRLV